MSMVAEKYSRDLEVPYISELKQGTNRSLVSFTSLVISSDNVNRGLDESPSSFYSSAIPLKCFLVLRNRGLPHISMKSKSS